MEQQIRDVLHSHGNLAVDMREVARTDDLYELGLTSHATVGVMLELEETFDLEFPDEMLRASTFRTIDSIGAALGSLGVGNS